MGEVSDRKHVLENVFDQYDKNGSGELSPVEVQHLHGDIRMGGISYPQVLASMKYTCAGGTCQKTELYDLLQEMDRRYFLMQDLRWEFSLLDREQKDTITEDQARWLVQAMHGKNFSRRKWADFLRKRAVPGSQMSLPEIEVLLCNVKSSLDVLHDKEDEERERQDRLRREQLAEEEARREQERLRNLREEERRRKEKEEQRLKEEARRRMLDEEDMRLNEKHRLEEEERMREEQRLKELEEQYKLEEEIKRKEDEEKYKDAEIIAEEAEREEREFEEELKRIRKQKKEAQDEKTRKDAEEKEQRLIHLHREVKHKRIRYRLKVAMKTKDKFKLEYSINEFKKEKVEDKDLELEKAERLLKELVSKDNLKRAMSKREMEELERAINVIKKNGIEVQLARELIEANKILARLRKIQRIRSEILELKQSTVAEIRSYQNPPPIVHTVMTATFLILGHKEKETKDWKAVQALVGKTGKESLKRRCIECNAAKIPLNAANRAMVLLDKQGLDEVRDVSAGAATFYVFTVAMIEEAQEFAENGPPPEEPSIPTPKPARTTAVVSKTMTRSKTPTRTTATESKTTTPSKTPTRSTSQPRTPPASRKK